MTPQDLLVDVLAFDNNLTFDDMSSFVNKLPVLIALGYLDRTGNMKYYTDVFCVQVVKDPDTEFYYIDDDGRVSSIEFFYNVLTVKIEYTNPIFLIIAHA